MLTVVRLGIALMAILAATSPAFPGPIHDAARDGDLSKIKAMLLENPDMVNRAGGPGPGALSRLR